MRSLCVSLLHIAIPGTAREMESVTAALAIVSPPLPFSPGVAIIYFIQDKPLVLA